VACEQTHGRNWKRKTDREDKPRRLFDAARERARKQGLEFSITLDDVRRAWPADGVCPALGVALKQGKGKAHDASPTLDRINAAWHYTPNNIAVISLAANRAKGRMRASELERIAAWMRQQGMD
jgi:hypothetical protein